MQFLSWMQNKLNGSKVMKNRPNSISATHHMLDEPACKDEFSDWPQALLAIGTFGSNNLKEDSGRISTTIAEDSSSSDQDCVQEHPPEQEKEEEEEERELQNELKICLLGQVETNVDQMSNCSKSEDFCLKLERKDQKETFFVNSSLIQGRGRDLCLDNSKNGIGKRSLSFLLKKMFVCTSGFQPSSFKDPHPLSTDCRMEKILRAILNKKIYPQGSNSTMIIKKYLENKHMVAENDEDELQNYADHRSKWVKTDSEYIVLEI
ncbi:uncharacterized protein G2W53_006028 [Senna tora]|uniref:Uncharacterized protein n=1 Tax=Senna tora TaxID=362788 RepID=A0A834X399_9FABA|nr:uncharacterized protein G2W53_006028 [Senna tora]